MACSCPGAAGGGTDRRPSRGVPRRWTGGGAGTARGDPRTTPRRATLSVLDTVGRTLRIELQRVEIRGAGDFENAFRAVATSGAGGVVLQDDPLTRSARAQIAQLALKHRLPVSTGLPEVAESGALIAYGPDRVDLYRRAAALVDRIPRGPSPPSCQSNRPASSSWSSTSRPPRPSASRSRSQCCCGPTKSSSSPCSTNAA